MKNTQGFWSLGQIWPFHSSPQMWGSLLAQKPLNRRDRPDSGPQPGGVGLRQAPSAAHTEAGKGGARGQGGSSKPSLTSPDNTRFETIHAKNPLWGMQEGIQRGLGSSPSSMADMCPDDTEFIKTTPSLLTLTKHLYGLSQSLPGLGSWASVFSPQHHIGAYSTG